MDSVREDAKARAACAPELKEFEKVCASSWVSLWIFLREILRGRLAWIKLSRT